MVNVSSSISSSIDSNGSRTDSNANTSSQEDRRRSVFVTVGTTLFDALVRTVVSPRFLDLAASRGYGAMTVQYGNGDAAVSSSSSSAAIRVDGYCFKPSLDEDLCRADLIVSHAGAGSIMEGLAQCRRRRSSGSRSSTKLIVVVNSQLMHNHQQELAGALAARGHVLCLPDPECLLDEAVWRDRIDGWEGTPFPEGDGGQDFAALADGCLGFS